MKRANEIARAAEDIRHETDLYGSEARFENAQRLYVLSRVFDEVANDYQSKAFEARRRSREVTEAAAELLKGSNKPELFAVVAKYLYEEDE